MLQCCVPRRAREYVLPTHHLLPSLPCAADSDGGPIKLFGINFGAAYYALLPLGSVVPAPAIILGGATCTEPAFVAGTGEPYLSCTADRHTVGYKNLTITVAGQVLVLSANWAANRAAGAVFTYQSYCQILKYGSDNELCLKCPQGALCGQCINSAVHCTAEMACPRFVETYPDGTMVQMCQSEYYNEPYAQVGWWNAPLPTFIGDTFNALCPPERANRTFCPFFIPCQPLESCTGNNTCAPAYTGSRCAECASGYYRMDGVCKPCPSNPWLLVVGFVGVVLLAIGFGFVLNKKNMHLAFISIGVDYLQVLAMFSKAHVPWPPVLAQIFSYLQFFNVNLELTAPECTFPGFTFKDKWLLIEGLPLAALYLLGTAYALIYLHKRLVLGRRKNLHTHADAMVGSAFSIMYYLYLYLTRTSLVRALHCRCCVRFWLQLRC